MYEWGMSNSSCPHTQSYQKWSVSIYCVSSSSAKIAKKYSPGAKQHSLALLNLCASGGCFVFVRYPPNENWIPIPCTYYRFQPL